MLIGKEAQLHHIHDNRYNLTIKVINICLPVEAGIMLPLCFINLYTLLFCCGNILKFPSLFLYMNIIIMDVFHGIVAIIVAIDTKRATKWIDVGLNMFQVSFNGEIVLMFGVVFIRWAWVTLNPLRIIGNLRTLAHALAAASWIFGLCAVIFAKMVHAHYKFPRAPYYPYFAFYDLGECFVLIIALILSLYTNIKLRRTKSYISHHNYKMASRTTLALTVNFTISYIYYIFLNIERWVSVKGKVPYWINEIIFRQSLNIGVSWMLLQGIITGIILLTMRRTRNGLWYRTRRMWYRKLYLTSGYQKLHNQF